MIQRGLHHIQEREERVADWAAWEIDVSVVKAYYNKVVLPVVARLIQPVLLQLQRL